MAKKRTLPAPGIPAISTREVRFETGRFSGTVSGILLSPPDLRWIFVFAHGAGAGMQHPFMESVASLLAQRGVGSFRYQFPYMEKGSRRPDPKPVLFDTVRAAVRTASELSGGVPLIAGGKSMGGRMTSMTAAQHALPDVRGIVFLGFPLHPPGKPSVERAEHLFQVRIPMLFLQGTLDALADLSLLRPVCGQLGTRATLHVEDGADHSFRVQKTSGMTNSDKLLRIVNAVVAWLDNL
jgi:predicted alpha/beta-hydrolase family hydrolase